MEKEIVVVTVIGEDKTGIVAGISTILATYDVNIEDITQTIVDKYFAMIMLVDISHSAISLEELQQRLQIKGAEMNVDVRAQHENVFKAMHRI